MTDKKRILVVDPNEKRRGPIADLLTSQGFEVIQTNSGREAIKELENQPSDMMITALNMTGIDGKLLLEMVRHRETRYSREVKEIPVFVISGGILSQNKQGLINLGFTNAFNSTEVKPLIDAVVDLFKVTAKS